MSLSGKIVCGFVTGVGSVSDSKSLLTLTVLQVVLDMLLCMLKFDVTLRLVFSPRFLFFGRLTAISESDSSDKA